MTISYSNIERSCWHAGQYVGYADGPWRITRRLNGVWLATRQQLPWAQLEAPTLVKMSAKLTAWEAEHAQKDKAG